MIAATYRVTSATKNAKGDIVVSLVDAEKSDDGRITMVVDGAEQTDVDDEFAVGATFEVTLSRVK